MHELKRCSTLIFITCTSHRALKARQGPNILLLESLPALVAHLILPLMLLLYYQIPGFTDHEPHNHLAKRSHRKPFFWVGMPSLRIGFNNTKPMTALSSHLGNLLSFSIFQIGFTCRVRDCVLGYL